MNTSLRFPPLIFFIKVEVRIRSYRLKMTRNRERVPMWIGTSSSAQLVWGANMFSDYWNYLKLLITMICEYNVTHAWVPGYKEINGNKITDSLSTSFKLSTSLKPVFEITKNRPVNGKVKSVILDPCAKAERQ